MAFIKYNRDLIKNLSSPRGKLEANVTLSKSTWFRVGGPAEVMFWPADIDDLIVFLRNKPDEIPVTIIGAGSNLMVRDGGIPGVVIRLGKIFQESFISGSKSRVGGGIQISNLRTLLEKTEFQALNFCVVFLAQ